MNISGIIVTTAPDMKDAVVTEIGNMQNIEVNDASLNQTVIATVEVETLGDAAAIFKNVHDITGVTNVSLACSYEVEEGEQLIN
ncbi:MAG TPA: hypothetical protein ENI99_03855 [Sedimenticola sp.]|nr:hypothetical protein [Sedimenticola sp.]